jgi:hypothetical protein
MPRSLALTGVSALMCLVGCTHDGFLVQPAGSDRPTLVVAGTVSEVSALLQDKLSIPVIAKPDGPRERLVGVTRSGKSFCLHLRPAASAKGDYTVVCIEWGKDPDEQFSRTVTKVLKGTVETKGP